MTFATSGELAAGQVLRIEQLETRFGVSRSVIREAMLDPDNSL
jgi:DNA-binding GntR family transcriptional regulator